MTYEFEAVYRHEDGYIENRLIGGYDSKEDAMSAASKLNRMWMMEEPYMELVKIEVREEA